MTVAVTEQIVSSLYHSEYGVAASTGGPSAKMISSVRRRKRMT